MTKLRRSLRAAAQTAGQEPPSITTIQRVGFRLDGQVVFVQPPDPSAELNERELGA